MCRALLKAGTAVVRITLNVNTFPTTAYQAIGAGVAARAAVARVPCGVFAVPAKATCVPAPWVPLAVGTDRGVAGAGQRPLPPPQSKAEKVGVRRNRNLRMLRLQFPGRNNSMASSYQ